MDPIAPIPAQPPSPSGNAPTMIPPMQPATPPPSNVSFPPKKKASGFTVFIIISVLILLGVWGFVGYLYIGNKTIATSNDTVTQAPSPTPEFNPAEIQIVNGDIARVTSFGESKTLVKKEDYPGAGIIGFVRVSVSPDNNKLCFESVPPASDPTLYISNSDGTGVVEVAKNRHSCIWLSDSKHIIYVNDLLGSKEINIFQYHLDESKEQNMTESTQSDSNIKQYALSGTGSQITCTYDTLDSSGKKISGGTCQIDINSGDVTIDPNR